MSAPFKSSQQGFYNIRPDFLHSEDFLRKIKLSHLQAVIGDCVLAGPHPRFPAAQRRGCPVRCCLGLQPVLGPQHLGTFSSPDGTKEVFNGKTDTPYPRTCLTWF